MIQFFLATKQKVTDTEGNVTLKYVLNGVEAKNPRKLGEYEGKDIIQELNENPEKRKLMAQDEGYLSDALFKIQILAPAIANQAIDVTWVVDEIDPETGQPITKKRGTVAEWLEAGKPELIDAFARNVYVDVLYE